MDETRCRPGALQTPQRSTFQSVLLVEDNEGDAVLVRRLLTRTATDRFELAVASNLRDAREYLLIEYADCVLLDLSLPDAAGLESVHGVRAANPDIPIVVLSGSHDEALAMSALHEGAQDYLDKNTVDGSLLWRAMRYAAERKRSEDALRHQADHDSLTGLANRSLFRDRLGTAISRLGRHNRRLAVLFVDLDRFKWVNDSLGHDAGDELIVKVAERINDVLRAGDIAGRLGGDEFLVLVDDVQTHFDALAVADRIHGALAVPFTIADVDVRVTGSIGLAMCENPSVQPDDLLRDADVAMYRAKALGKARTELFDTELRELARTRLQLENDLHRGVERDEFELHYQPVIDLTDGRTVGAEALVRWRHPSGIVVPPGDFVAVAEETGLIVPIGNYVLRAACDQLQSWSASSAEPPSLNINLSTRQIGDPDLVDQVAEVLARTAIAPSQLCLEVTELSIMQEEVEALARLADLKELGVRLGIDDFGTGYSSLTYLKRYPFDVLKIDRSFTAGIGTNSDDTAIVEAIVHLAELLGIEVIVEGVETNAQMEHVRDLGCGLAQGFLFGRPAPASDICLPVTARR